MNMEYIVDDTNKCIYFAGSIFSNFYKTPVELLANKTLITFPTAEHAYMYLKAKEFLDHVAMIEIMHCQGPKSARERGQNIVGFNAELWEEVKVDRMAEVLFEKFRANPELRKKLYLYSNYTMVEASTDLSWGCGLERHDPLIRDRKNWTGKNLLGVAYKKAKQKLSVYLDDDAFNSEQ